MKLLGPMKPVNSRPVTSVVFVLLSKYFLSLTLFHWKYVDVEIKSGFGFPRLLYDLIFTYLFILVG